MLFDTRRQALEQVGFLDENYFIYTEETDLCYRLRKANWPVLFNPAATIIHYGGRSAQRQKEERVFSKSITRYLFTIRYYFFEKHYGYISSFILKSLDFVYFSALYIKNLFRRDIVMRKAKLDEARVVLSVIFCK